MKDFRGKSFDRQNKLVTVGVASYNNAPFVVSTLESIYNQSYAPIELRIVDDASSDSSAAIINEWINRREVLVQFTINERNRGVCYVCNVLIKQPASYLVLIGSDDEMQPDRLKRQVEYFDGLGTEYGLVYSDVATIDETGLLLEPSWLESKGFKPVEGDAFEAFLRNEFRFPTPSIIYRSDVFKVVGMYDEGLKTEDIDMLLRILRYYKAAYCPIVAVRYRTLTKSLSRNIGASFFKDRIRTYRKFLGFNDSVDNYVKKKIVGWAQRAYYSDYSECKSLLLQSVRIQFTMKTFLLLVLAFCGIRAGQLGKLIGLKNGLRSIISSRQ